MNPFLAGFIFEMEKRAVDPEGIVLGMSVIPLLKRLAATGNVAKANKIMAAMGSKGLDTSSLPFTIRNPTLGAVFAPGTLGKRVAEVETAAKEYAGRRFNRDTNRSIAEALEL